MGDCKTSTVNYILLLWAMSAADHIQDCFCLACFAFGQYVFIKDLNHQNNIGVQIVGVT